MSFFCLCLCVHGCCVCVMHCICIGGVQMLVEKVLDGSYMSSLIKQPSGCGEQNVARMSLPVIATTYLDKTNQWDRVGTSKRDVALGYISSGTALYTSFFRQCCSESVSFECS